MHKRPLGGQASPGTQTIGNGEHPEVPLAVLDVRQVCRPQRIAIPVPSGNPPAAEQCDLGSFRSLDGQSGIVGDQMDRPVDKVFARLQDDSARLTSGLLTGQLNRRRQRGQRTVLSAIDRRRDGARPGVIALG